MVTGQGYLDAPEDPGTGSQEEPDEPDSGSQPPEE
jgi:hypothetical protein